MIGFAAAFIAAATLSARLVSAQDQPQCGPDTPCPEEAPCCSQYGQCGVGAYCLGGCDIRYSHSLDSCVPAPVCKDMNFKFSSLKDIEAINYYLGDANQADWQATGRPVPYNDDGLLLTMAPDTTGTLLASTHYVWYGRISTTMTTSRGAGVVTAFIMMSDVQDEIDFEFVGVDIEAAQSNYYYQGYLDYTHSANLSTTNTYSDIHTYTIDWTPNSITWEIDGKPMRTLQKSDTWNKTTNHYDFPQTPSRVMLSLWPAGLPKNGQGTINWAGGLVDWNSPYMTNGYYAALFKEVDIKCYNPPSDAQGSSGQAYKYTDTQGWENDVEFVDHMVVLKSLEDSGEDPNAHNPNKAKPSKSSKGSSPSSTSSAKHSYTPESIPGQSGGGGREIESDPKGPAGGGGGSGGGSNDKDPKDPLSTGLSVPGGFRQGSSASTMVRQQGGVVGGSVCAVVIAVLALLLI